MTESTDLTSGTDQNSEQNQGTGLSGLKLAQLQALAAQLGITGARRMRKSLLVDAIQAHQRGGAVAERDVEVAEKIEKTAQRAAAKAQGDDASSAQAGEPKVEPEAGDLPKVSARTGRGRRLGVELAIGERVASEVGGGALGKPRDGGREEIRQGSAIMNICHSR